MTLGPWSIQSSPQDYSGQTRNLNLHYVSTQGPTQGAHLVREGLVSVANLGGIVRAAVELDGDIIAAAAGRLWRLGSSGVLTDEGAVQDSNNLVMAAGFSKVAITSGGKYYVYDGAVSIRTTGQITNPVGVAYMDGYYIVIGDDGARRDLIAVSGPDDPYTFAALDFASAEGDPDPLVAIVRDHSELKLFGTKTTETFYNSGGTFPFSRNTSAFIERGCHNAQTVAKSDNAVYWIGDDKKAYRTFGGGPEIISTDPLSELFAKSTILGGFAFEDRGAKFYAVRLAGGTTWAYKIPTGLWCEFSTGADHAPWIATCMASAGSVQYFGTSTGKICTHSGFEDDGSVIRAELWGMPMTEMVNDLRYVELQVDTGKGDLGREGTISLDVSPDGKLWTTDDTRSLGSMGNYRIVPKWHNLGTYLNFVQLRVWTTDPMARDIYGGRLG